MEGDKSRLIVGRQMGNEFIVQPSCFTSAFLQMIDNQVVLGKPQARAQCK